MRTNPFLTIKEAAEQIGVSQDTLINWEKAGKLVPRKNSLGWRLYSPSDIQRAKALIYPEGAVAGV